MCRLRTEQTDEEARWIRISEQHSCISRRLQEDAVGTYLGHICSALALNRPVTYAKIKLQWARIWRARAFSPQSSENASSCTQHGIMVFLVQVPTVIRRI